MNLAARRILLGDKVAAAKFGTSSPIDDPAREQQVLDQAAALAQAKGIDVATTQTFFRAQIDANKIVQHGLFNRWTAHPGLAPKTRPDLTTEVRPQLDEITTEFIDQLAATTAIRNDTDRCGKSLILAVAGATIEDRLDHLHRNAMRTAVAGICAS